MDINWVCQVISASTSIKQTSTQKQHTAQITDYCGIYQTEKADLFISKFSLLLMISFDP